MIDRVLRLPDVVAAVGLRRSAIYARVRDGRFPAPINITSHAVGWRESELKTWIEQRPCQRPTAKGNWPTIRVRHRTRPGALVDHK